MTAPHTPEPWTHNMLIQDANGLEIARISYESGHVQANARLIAAAPQLLRAVRLALEVMASQADIEHSLHGGRISWTSLRDEMQLAITAATPQEA